MDVTARQKLRWGLQGGRCPRNAALAVVLGTAAGFVTGWNLSAAALLVLFAALNVRTKLFAGAWCAGATASIAASGLTYRIGYFLLDGTPLGAAIGWLGEGVFVSLLAWDQYSLVGGAGLGLLLSLPAAKLAAKWAAASPAPDAGEMREPWLRPYGIVWSLAVMAACGWATWSLGPRLVERELLEQLSTANGAPVEAGDVQFSLWTGELKIQDLQIVDPERLDRDRVRIGRITAKTAPGPLLRGRLETDKLEASKIRADVARHRAASSAERVANRAPRFTLRDGHFDVASHELELDSCLKHWPEFRDRLAWLGRLTAAIESLAELEEQTSAAAPYGERSRLGRTAARVQIAFLRADDLGDDWKLGGDARLEITRLSSRPQLLTAATRLKISAPELDAQLTAELKLHEHEKDRRHRVQAWAYNWQLADFFDSAASHHSVVVSNAKADLTIEGWINSDRCELQLNVDAKSLGARVDSAMKFAGLDAETWNQGIERLRSLRAEAKLEGQWGAPALTVDRQRLVEQFKHQLRAAGEHDLVQSIDKQLSSPPAAETASESALAKTPAEPEDDFFTISDEAPAAPPETPVEEGWHRAKTAPPKSGERLEAAAPAYPKTNAPDSDPADRLLSRLTRPSATEMTQPLVDANESTSGGSPAERTAARSQPAAAGKRYPSSPPRPEQPLPGPINLVVGQYDRSPASQPERPQWPSADGDMQGDFAEPEPQPGFLSRMANGARDAIRRIAPRRQPTPEYDLPPDLPAESEMPSAPYLGPEEPIDEALEQRPPARESMLKRWFR